MIIEVDNSFKKDFKSLKNKELEKRIIDKLSEIELYESIWDFVGLKKMIWFKDFYRIRVWDYRIWFKLIWNKVILLRVRNRKDIYNVFP